MVFYEHNDIAIEGYGYLRMTEKTCCYRARAWRCPSIVSGHDIPERAQVNENGEPIARLLSPRVLIPAFITERLRKPKFRGV